MLKIGVFDSGLGGLTVVQSMIDIIKGTEIFYIADTLHAPYGEKTPQEILKYSLHITHYFLDIHQIDVLVIACNTATSAAITFLRNTFPELIIVGTEPAIKPAIEQSKTTHIGVLATPATLQGDKYQKLVERLSLGTAITLHEQACPGLVEHIEHNTLKSQESMLLLHRWLEPMRENNVDTIVLGCTHYPLAKSVIKEVMKKEVTLLDSGDAIAHRVLSLIPKHDNTYDNSSQLHLYTTGKIDQQVVKNLLNKPIELIVL